MRLLAGASNWLKGGRLADLQSGYRNMVRQTAGRCTARKTGWYVALCGNEGRREGQKWQNSGFLALMVLELAIEPQGRALDGQSS